ncbi:MAG: hypothetical protein R6U63_15070 [Longimicrobiales bacterium]
MTDPAPAGRAALLGALALGVAFLAGVGVGALVFGDDPEPLTPRQAPPPALFEDLDLSAEQRAHVDSVLTAAGRATDAILDDARVELTAQATEALRAIEVELTPEQIETVKDRIRHRRTAGAGPPELDSLR